MEVSTLPSAGRPLLLRSQRLLATLPDERLVAQVRRGNEAAFEALYDRHHRGILSFCRHMLGSAEEAEDAVQQTFLSAFRALGQSDKPISLKAWLYAIARNRCLSMLRARREQAQEVPEIATAGVSETVLERDDLRRLLVDVHGLPEDQRAALVLSELGDLSHSDIAEIVGCDPLKIKSLVFQARSSLLESHRAQEIPCHEIREQLATLRGGALRRAPLRRHLRSCQGCSEFRDDVRRQRAMLALVLPVVPSVGLKQSVLVAAGVKAAGPGGAAAGGAAAGGGLAGGAATTGGVASVAGPGVVGGIGGASGGGGVLSSLAAVGAAGAAKAALVAVVAVGAGVGIRDAAVSNSSPHGSSSSVGTAHPGKSSAADRGSFGGSVIPGTAAGTATGRSAGASHGAGHGNRQSGGQGKGHGQGKGKGKSSGSAGGGSAGSTTSSSRGNGSTNAHVSHGAGQSGLGVSSQPPPQVDGGHLQPPQSHGIGAGRPPHPVHPTTPGSTRSHGLQATG